MLLVAMAQLLEAEPLSQRWDRTLDVGYGFAADLMSDVLSLARPGSVLVTGLANPQVIRTSEVAEVAAIVMVRGKRPLAETAALAKEAGIPIFCTAMTMFEACGRLYGAGVKPARTSYSLPVEVELERDR